MTFKIPALPDPKDDLRFNQAVKEWFEIREGMRGPKSSDGRRPNQLITIDMLEDLLLNSSLIGTALTTIVTSLVGFGPPTEKTISAGAITVTGSSYWRFHTLDTQDDDPSDDLTTITGGSAGELLLLKPVNDARTIVCKNGASLLLGTDFTMDSLKDALLLVCISLSVWHPLSKYNGG